MEFLQSRIYASIRAARHNLLQDEARAEVDINEHRNILEAIRRRDPSAARAAILTHLTNAAQNMASTLAIIMVIPLHFRRCWNWPL